jgi:hypothetical protein
MGCVTFGSLCIFRRRAVWGRQGSVDRHILAIIDTDYYDNIFYFKLTYTAGTLLQYIWY